MAGAASFRVMVIDDDMAIRVTLAGVLEDEGYDVVTASNGRDALALLRSQPDRLPHTIVLDLMMPVMSGTQFRRCQLEDETLAAIPVVVMSADPGAKRQAAALAAVDGLTKPVRMAELLEAVARSCGPDAPART